MSLLYAESSACEHMHEELPRYEHMILADIATAVQSIDESKAKYAVRENKGPAQYKLTGVLYAQSSSLLSQFRQCRKRWQMAPQSTGPNAP